jgi:nitroreductase
LKKEVPKETVDALLKAAMAAPSANGCDPWRFVVVRKPSRLIALTEKLPYGKMLADAPLGIIVCGDIAAANGSELSYMLQDCSAAIENLLLAVHAMGLGACWLGVHPRQDRMEHVAKVCGLPENIIPVCAFAIGYPDEQKEPRTRYNAGYVHYGKW